MRVALSKDRKEWVFIPDFMLHGYNLFVTVNVCERNWVMDNAVVNKTGNVHKTLRCVCATVVVVQSSKYHIF